MKRILSVPLVMSLAIPACGHLVPEPEPEACPVERCKRIAIVPAMPRAMSGGEDAPDHWMRITNRSDESVTVIVTGRDDAGTEFRAYRRDLPAYGSVRARMRDIEAALDAAKPEGWWTLTVNAKRANST